MPAGSSPTLSRLASASDHWPPRPPLGSALEQIEQDFRNPRTNPTHAPPHRDDDLNGSRTGLRSNEPPGIAQASPTACSNPSKSIILLPWTISTGGLCSPDRPDSMESTLLKQAKRRSTCLRTGTRARAPSTRVTDCPAATRSGIPAADVHRDAGLAGSYDPEGRDPARVGTCSRWGAGAQPVGSEAP